MKEVLPTNTTRENSDSRRQFLHTAGAIAGALVLTRALPSEAQDGAATAAPATASTVLPLSEHPDLAKVGGFEVVGVGEARVIVAHTEAGFVACSAICTHKGCEIAYRAADKQFVCPCHGARFDEGGKVVKGPAKLDLKPFDAANALVVKPLA